MKSKSKLLLLLAFAVLALVGSPAALANTEAVSRAVLEKSDGFWDTGGAEPDGDRNP